MLRDLVNYHVTFNIFVAPRLIQHVRLLIVPWTFGSEETNVLSVEGFKMASAYFWIPILSAAGIIAICNVIISLVKSYRRARHLAVFPSAPSDWFTGHRKHVRLFIFFTIETYWYTADVTVCLYFYITCYVNSDDHEIIIAALRIWSDRLIF